MATLSQKIARNALLILTGLVVAYVHLIVQYENYLWESIVQFLSWWFAHYILVVLLTMTSYAVIKGTEKIFFGNDNMKKGLTFEQAIVYIPLILLVAVAFIFTMWYLGYLSTCVNTQGLKYS